MNTRFDEELFLTTETGRHLYHKYAEHMPIIDYNCHLQPSEILEDKEFEDLGEMWLRGDHYKWRAMRTFGIDERYITGDADFHEKYLELGQDVHFLMVNVTDGSWDTEESASAFLKEEGYTFPALFDTDSSATGAYGVYALPATYFIDGEGYAVAWAGGMIGSDTLQQGIDMILE